MKIEGINFTVFTTFLGDKWRFNHKKMTDETAGKMWKALVEFFDTGTDATFDDPVVQCLYEEFKQANIRNAKKNQEKNEKKKLKALQAKAEEPTIPVKPENV